jgi:transposase
MTTSDSESLLAFDIGARTHQFFYETQGRCEGGELPNEPATLRAFLERLLRNGRGLRIILEATGIYFLDLALLAHELGAEVVVINPKQAHNFAKALGQRSKTDALDARMLLECLRRMPLNRWEPPARECLQLRQIGRYLVQLTDEATAARNRLHALESSESTPRFLRQDLRRSIRTLEGRIERVRAQAVKLIERSESLQAVFEALTTMVGMAEKSAVTVLGELCVLPRSLSGRACTSHAGLDVRQHQSGTSVSKPGRISKQGNKYLRRALYMPALSAGVHDPHAAAFKQRLKAHGKKPLQIITAVMRKMLTAAWAIVKDPRPYDGARLYADLKPG